MQFSLFDLLGTVGVALIVFTYVLLQMEKIRSGSLMYSLLNALGSGLIGVSLIFNFNFSAFAVEFFWFFISLYGMGKYFFRKKSEA